MRLLRHEADGSFSLCEFVGKDVPHYAVLSHTWGRDEDEVSYQDLANGGGRCKPGYKKIEFTGKQAARDDLQYFWVDTCCIDKSSSAELSEAINSMFRWYRDAAKCYVYLSDVSADDSCGTSSSDSIQQSRWFTRSWTLQELLAPPLVEFFSEEGRFLGDKKSLLQEIHHATRIPMLALQGQPLSHFNVIERISWARKRVAKREEDSAYSLLGLFDVHMPLIYGEGREKAFTRLTREIRRPSNDAQPVSFPIHPPFHPMQRERPKKPSRSYTKKFEVFNQFNAPCGTQNISTGSGHQFPGASFSGPVYLER